MMSTKTTTPVVLLVGAVLMGGLGGAQAAENPFAADAVRSGHTQLAEAEGKCGEGKCGSDMEGEGKCGEGKEGGEKEGEGKCGEGKCGGN